MNSDSIYRSDSDFLSVEEYLQLFGIEDSHLEEVKVFGEHLMPHFAELMDDFYSWMKQMPDFDVFFESEEAIARVKHLQHEYWETFFGGVIDEGYIATRRRVGHAHARIGLPPNTYLAAMNRFMIFFQKLLEKNAPELAKQASIYDAASKLLHLDTSLVIESYNIIIEESLTSQSKMLMQMSTPVTEIWGGVLLLPIVGLIDSKRARDVMNAALTKIADSHARIFIIDISGVAVVDTAVANHLIKISKASQLMGCTCTISGISPSISQTIVDLGIDVSSVKTVATMKDALADAFEVVGMQIVDQHASS